MINQVVLVGRLLQDPLVGADRSTAELQLEVERKSRWGARAETCTVVVRASGRPAETISRYLKKGRAIVVQGHLRAEGPSLIVVLDSFEFTEDGLVSFALEAGAVPATAPRALAPRLMPVTG